MKTPSLLLLIFILTSSFSCRKEANVNAVVIKDCTGVYLRINSSDFRVCNKSKLANFDNGKQVTASFKIAANGNCEADDDIVCMMLHEYKERIVVTKIE